MPFLLYRSHNHEEKRLNRLQGSDKRSIRSKDIMNSLSEARDDHMQQITDPISSSAQHHHSTGTILNRDSENTILHRDSEPARNDPWHAIPPSTDTSQRQVVENELQSDFFVPVEIEKSGCGFSKCISCLTCVCCRRTGHRTRLHRARRVRSSLSAEEEREYLMDCDELGLMWEGDGEENENRSDY